MNNYIQIEIGGKLRGLKFNQLALEVFTKHTDYQTTHGDLYACIYGGLRGNSYVRREEPDYTFEEVCDWCDETDNAKIVEAYNLFTETQNFKDWYEKFKDLVRSKIEETAEGEKKNQA